MGDKRQAGLTRLQSMPQPRARPGSGPAAPRQGTKTVMLRRIQPSSPHARWKRGEISMAEARQLSTPPIDAMETHRLRPDDG